MKYTGIATTACFVAFLLNPGPVVAQDDVAGSRDHPLLTRMPGFYIADYRKEDFTQADFKNAKGDDITIEGRSFDIFYSLEEGESSPSPLQVVRNYENALLAIGGRLVHQSGKEAWLQVDRGGGTTWVYLDARTSGEYELLIVEKEVMAQQVVADAASLARNLRTSGHVAVAGIHFDFNKAVVKPESRPALEEVSKVLHNDAELRLLVVGHTDNVGAIDANIKLSLARAKAVVAALATDFGVDRSRLSPHGAGPLAPVATNETEQGRAENRRVELVKW